MTYRMVIGVLFVVVVEVVLACGLAWNDPILQENAEDIVWCGERPGLESLPPPYDGFTSLAERIADADLIVLARMESVMSEVEMAEIQGITGYVGALKFTFSVEEIYKSSADSSPAEVVAMVGTRCQYRTPADAQPEADRILAQRASRWDDRSAIIFLATHSVEYPVTLSDDVYFMSTLDYTFGIGDHYSVASKRNRMWLPEEKISADTGARSDAERRFLTGIPQDQIRSGAVALALIEPHSMTLADLRDEITRIENELSIDTSIGYRLCMTRKYRRERIAAYRAVEGRSYDPPSSTLTDEIGSGLSAGTAVLDDNWNVTVGPEGWESSSQYIGTDAELFSVGAIKDTTSKTGRITTSSQAVKGTYDYEWRLVPLMTMRPLPKGTYNLTLREYMPCDPDFVYNHAIIVTVTAPSSTLHEAFFDPVTDSSAVAADATIGQLEPAAFSDAKGRATTIQRIEWQAGVVTVKVSPHTGLAGHKLDFIELDGTVSLSLQVDDATVDAANNTLSWAVSEQPWEDGDLLMLRIWESRQ